MYGLSFCAGDLLHPDPWISTPGNTWWDLQKVGRKVPSLPFIPVFHFGIHHFLEAAEKCLLFPADLALVLNIAVSLITSICIQDKTQDFHTMEISRDSLKHSQNFPEKTKAQ